MVNISGKHSGFLTLRRWLDASFLLISFHFFRFAVGYPNPGLAPNGIRPITPETGLDRYLFRDWVLGIDLDRDRLVTVLLKAGIFYALFSRLV